MISSISPQALHSLQNFVRVAKVERVVDSNQILLSLTDNNKLIETWACFAMGNAPLPAKGDSVLIAGEALDNCFIIGHFPAQPAEFKKFNISQDVDSGKTVLSVQEGDLDLRSEKGSIKLDAAKHIELNSPQFSVQSGKANIDLADAQYQGVRFTASVSQTRLFLGKVNSTVGRLVEKAKNVYRQVEQLNQLKSGRMRTLVKGSYHLKGESINQKADKDVCIDGDKINLG